MDDWELTPEDEFNWEWNQKRVSPEMARFLCSFGLIFAVHRFTIGQWKAAIAIIAFVIFCAVLAQNYGEIYLLSVLPPYFYEWMTAKERFVAYNENLRRELKRKWKVKDV